jgi:hypothetical protein
MKKKLLFLITFFSLVFFSLFCIVSPDRNSYLPNQRRIEPNKFNLDLHLNGKIDKSEPITSFPYKTYLDSADYFNLSSIKTDLAVIDKYYPSDSSISRQIISEALTNKYTGKTEINFQTYNPDSLLLMLQWAERFKYYSEASININDSLLFSSIHSYWLSFLSNKLSAYSKQNSKINHQFKFEYLAARLQEQNFPVPTTKTKVEKVTANLINSDWGHLLNASYNQASWKQVLILLLLFFIFLYGIYCIINKHFFK